LWILLRDFAGRPIRLTDERLQHIREHPEMLGLEPAIAVALAQPEHVVVSWQDPSVLLYHRLQRVTGVGEKYLCVVVKFGVDDAFVLTAYLTDTVKRGIRLWPPEP
jgi:hypothetical protein